MYKLQWYQYNFIPENALEDVVCKMAVIFVSAPSDITVYVNVSNCLMRNNDLDQTLPMWNGYYKWHTSLCWSAAQEITVVHIDMLIP